VTAKLAAHSGLTYVLIISATKVGFAVLGFDDAPVAAQMSGEAGPQIFGHAGIECATGGDNAAQFKQFDGDAECLVSRHKLDPIAAPTAERRHAPFGNNAIDAVLPEAGPRARRLP
jgi:hypothetical protein